MTETTSTPSVPIEECLREIHCINDRPIGWLCRLAGHSWIDASLNAWPTNKAGLCAIKNDSYELISFCLRCKIIRCLHHFQTEKIVEPHGPWCHVERLIGTCTLCHRRLQLGAGTYFTPDERAVRIVWQLLAEAEQNGQHFGSGFRCELPAQVSAILRQQGEEAARCYAESVIRRKEVIPEEVLYQRPDWTTAEPREDPIHPDAK